MDGAAMKILILWCGQDSRLQGVAQRLGAHPGVDVEQVRPARSVGLLARCWRRLTGMPLQLRPLTHDPKTYNRVAVCFAVPGGRIPLEAVSLLRQHRDHLPRLGLLILPDHIVSATAPVIERFEQLAGQRPVACQEIPAVELNPDGTGIAERPWLSQCHIDSFLRQLGLDIPDTKPLTKEP